MIWLILIASCFSHVHALYKCSGCKAAPRGFKSSKVLDMDFLMDFQYPKTIEQEDTVAEGYPVSGHFDRLVTSFEFNPSTEDSIVWEQRGVVKSEGKSGLPHAKDQSPVRKCIRKHKGGIKHDLLTMMNVHKSRQAGRQDMPQYGRPRSYFHVQRRHAMAKRYYVSRKQLLQHIPISRRLKMHPYRTNPWTPWHTNGHVVNVTKRETSNMRMKLSDILTRAGLKKDKEEAIKVVLPLLLSDLKETPTKGANPFVTGNTELKEQLHSPVISSSSGKQLRRMRNFKVKGDDGKEFSFSASASDFQQLMDILAKPNSSIVLEKVSLDKNPSLLKSQTDRTKPPGRKTIPSCNKAKESMDLENVNNTEALQLKEFDTSVFESILQLDVPSKQKKSAKCFPDSIKDGDSTASGDTS